MLHGEVTFKSEKMPVFAPQGSAVTSLSDLLCVFVLIYPLLMLLPRPPHLLF